MRNAFALTAMLLLAVPGCRPERDVYHPEGAYEAVVDAYADKDANALWGLVTAKTHRQLEEAHAGLNELKELISTGFPVGQRKEALHAVGVPLLDGVSGPRALFTKLVRLDALRVDGGVKYGAEVRESQIDLEGGEAVFHSQSGQAWSLIRVEDGSWRSTHLEPVFEKRLEVLRGNLTGTKAFVKKAKTHDAAVETRFQELASGRKAASSAPTDKVEEAAGSGKKKGKKKRRKKRRKKR